MGKMGLIVNELIVAVSYVLDIIISILNISKPKFVDILSKLISFLILLTSFLVLY